MSDARESGWRILLLGGTTAAGKSTTAAQIARRLGIGRISGDSLWKGILAMTTPETHELLHRWPRADEEPGRADELSSLHIEEALALTPAIAAFIDHEVLERNRCVIHAAWLTPELAADKCKASDETRAVFIDEDDAGALLASIVKRSGRTAPSERQRIMAEVGRQYGAWLREGAQRLGLPLVASRPHETLAERILEAAGSGGREKS